MISAQSGETHRSRHIPKGSHHNRKGSRHMGYGLQNVKKTLEKYNGTVQTGSSDCEFQVNITLPKPERR